MIRIPGFSSRARRIVSVIPCISEVVKTSAIADSTPASTKRLAVAGVAVDARMPSPPSRPHGLQVQLDHDRLELVLAQQPGEVRPTGP